MIKKLLFLTAVMITATTTMTAQNLIANGDFEAGTGDTFTSWTKTNGAANLTAEGTIIHGGLRSLKAVSTGSAEYNVQMQSAAMPTVIGASYEVIIWVKALNGGNTIRLSTSGGTAIYQSAQTISTSWQQITWGFTANSSTTSINLDLGKSTDTFYVDDITVYTLSNNSIVNGGFETTPGASGNIFANWNAANGGAQISKETTNFRSGANAVKAISTGANEYSVQLQSDDVATTIGRYYEIAIWIKSVGGASGMRLSTSGGTAVYGATTTIGTSWQRLALVFKATAATTKLSMDLGKSTETFYIDDASFNAAQVTALGVNDFNIETSKTIFYPNPVTDNLNINSDADIKSVTISDLNGKTVRTIKNAENIQSVNLSDLSQGLYILSTDTNKQFKFIKK